MKLKHLVASLALALAGTSSMAITTDLGTLDANGTSFEQSFERAFFAYEVGSFTDYYTFTLMAPSTGVTGTTTDTIWTWNTLWTDITSVALLNATGGLQGLDRRSPESFTFAGLSAGSYTLAVSGNLYGWGATAYSGTIRAIASAAPEASSFAMALLGLLGVGAAAQRRRSEA